MTGDVMKMTMTQMRAARLMLTGVLVAALVACGGGGGSSGTSKYSDAATTTTPTTVATADSLFLTLSSTSVSDASSTPVVATVTAVSASGQAQSGIPVTFSVSGAVFTPSRTTTDTNGTVTASIDFTSDKSNRTVTVTVKSGALSETKEFQVSGVKISATPVPSILIPGVQGQVLIKVADANSTALSLLPITVTSASGSVSGKTDGNGSYTYDVTVPAGYTGTSWPLTIVSGGVSQVQPLVVQQGGGTSIPAAVGVISSASVEVDPAVFETNVAGSTANQATVRLKVFDNQSPPQPIKNVRVRFDLNGDPLNTGGVFSTGTSLVYTDSNGVATTSFIPGDVATGTGQLVLRACYSASDFGVSSCPTTATKTATINKEALNITIGPDDKIAETPDGLRYLVKYVVQVTNASGQAKANVRITPTLDLPGFLKGTYAYSKANSIWTQTVTNGASTFLDRDDSGITYVGCPNEDVNRNGISDSADVKDNDLVLEPRKSDAAISFVTTGQNLTDSTGAVYLQVTYLKNVATWLSVKIYAQGVVSGTEGVGTYQQILPAPTTVLKSDSDPAFEINPYGTNSSCSIH
jgi:hypothetical protein